MSGSGPKSLGENNHNQTKEVDGDQDFSFNFNDNAPIAIKTEKTTSQKTITMRLSPHLSTRTSAQLSIILTSPLHGLSRIYRTFLQHPLKRNVDRSGKPSQTLDTNDSVVVFLSVV